MEIDNGTFVGILDVVHDTVAHEIRVLRTVNSTINSRIGSLVSAETRILL